VPVLDAVVVYNIFGLNFEAVSALVRVVVTPIIIYLTIRIPFKRTYHWMFMILSLVFLLMASAVVWYELSPDAATAYARVWLLDVWQTRLQAVLIFQFVVYFIARKSNLWQKLVIIGGYAYVIATVELPLAIDPSFITGPSVLSSLGWNSVPGTSDQYLRPYGIDIFTTVVAVLIFSLLILHYRSEKSPLVRGQTKYLILGIGFFVASAFAVAISRDLGAATLPNPQQFLAAIGDFILLLGLRKKGFYSVVPVAATSPVPILYPLEEGRSYLAHDAKTSIEAFTNLVRNGREGLLITRTFPDDARKESGLETTPIRWLAESKRQDAVSPTDLLGLSITVKDFLQKAKKPVVMLHGIEYLTTINGFQPILRLIQGVSDANAESRGIVLLPVLPKSLDEKEEALLASETTPLPAPAASNK